MRNFNSPSPRRVDHRDIIREGGGKKKSRTGIERKISALSKGELIPPLPKPNAFAVEKSQC